MRTSLHFCQTATRFLLRLGTIAAAFLFLMPASPAVEQPTDSSIGNSAGPGVPPEPLVTDAHSMIFKDCGDCPEMVMLPAGSFLMESDMADRNEKRVRNVRIANSFALGRTEVTQGVWKAFMEHNPSRFPNCGDHCPVENVSWNDAHEFARRLSQKTGKNYRLPSEAEWEYACRAGGQQAYCGSDNIDSVAWYEGNSGGKTHPVANKQANLWGLYDMSGNVWEWTEDCWNDDGNGAPTDGSAWTTGKCSVGRVVRGGSWVNGRQDNRTAKRIGEFTSIRLINSGLRLARPLP